MIRSSHGLKPAKMRYALVLLLVAVLGAPSAYAAGLNVKMATLSPENSPWDKILKDMGKEWEASSDGEVSLTIYPGGVAGDEPDIIRKMQIGQYHAGAISVAGLVDIHKDFTVFEVPLFYRDFDEMLHVLNELTPTLDQRLDEKGYIRLAWGYVGWVHFFTSEAAESVDDMKEMKIFTWAGDEAMVQWWRRNGFQPVSLAATDIVTGLQTGMISAVAVPPLYSLQVQFYKQAKYMADVGLAPLMGAMLMTKRAWNRISEDDRAEILAAGKRAEEKVMDTIPKLDETAVKLMQSQGLEVVEIMGTDHAKDWIEAAERFAGDMRGDIVPVEIFDAAQEARDAYRAQKAAADSSGGE